jgi:photosystem II stability/assembly factor-like uncharacterized protein
MVALSPNGVDAYQLDAGPDDVLVGTKDGAVLLQFRAGRWREAGRSLIGRHVSALVTGLDGDVAYAGTHGHGVYRQAAGREWSDVSNGLASRNVYSLNYRRVAAGIELFAGTEPAYLFRRLDGADAWAEVVALRTIPGRAGWSFPAPPNIAHAKHVDFDPRDNRRYFVSIEQGALLKTDDDGATFRQIFFEDASYVYGNDLHRVIVNPLNPDELYLSGGDGITRSADGGVTWRHLTTPSMRVAYPDATFCSPFEDGVVFTAGAGARPGAWRSSGDADAAVARSNDHGETWTILDLPHLRGNIEAMTLVTWPAGYGFFAGTTDGEVFASLDAGRTWSLIAANLPPVSKGIHHDNVMRGRGAA